MFIKFLPLIVSTCGYIGFATVVLKVRPLLTPLLWASFVTTLIFGFALAGLLELGSRVALFLGIALGIIVLLKLSSSLPTPSIKWVTSFIFIAPIVLAFNAIPPDFVFLGWDEVGFWAKTQKLVYDTNALLQANSPLDMRSYPPGQQLFQYYITKSSWWSEKNLLLAQSVFLFSGLLALTGALITRNGWRVIVYLTLIPIIYFFHFDYTTIYADPLLAAVFAGCLGLALKPRESRTDDIVLSICLCGLVLLKDIAIVFAVLCLALYFWNVYSLTNLENRKSVGQRVAHAGGVTLISGIALFVVLRAWKWYVGIIGSFQNEPLHFTISTLADPAFQARLGTTISGFGLQLLSPNFFSGNLGEVQVNLSLAGVMTAVILINVLTVVLTPNTRRTTLLLSVGGMFAGSVGYLLLLLWLYLTHFTEYEGTRLASFNRYTMTYLLAWYLASYTLLVSTLSNFSNRRLTVLTATGLLLTLAFVPSKFYRDAWHIPVDQVNFEKKKKAQALADLVRKHIKTGEKVYFIAQDTNGYERHLFDFAMLPYPPVSCWSIGKKYNPGDVWSCDRPLGYFLQGYAYLAIYRADDRFWSENSELFDESGRGKESGVYRVTHPNHNQILLLPIEEHQR